MMLCSISGFSAIPSYSFEPYSKAVKFFKLQALFFMNRSISRAIGSSFVMVWHSFGQFSW